MAATRIRAAIYTRISLDRRADDPTYGRSGVKRQEQDCRKLCTARGWSVVDVYEDNDTSAYSGKRRTAYERMLADIAAGKVNAVVVWHLDRLHRRPIELEQFMDLADQHRVRLATVTGDIDLGTDSGRLHARIMGAVARAESERKSARVTRANAQRAEQGRRGNNTRAFGHDGARIVPAEARIIRECAKRILAGESLNAVTIDLAERGVTTLTGRPFDAQRIKRLLVSARISGRREYIPIADYRGRGKARPMIGAIVADATDRKKIIEPADSDRLRAMLTDPARRVNNRGGVATGRPPTTLLSGILRCTRCNGWPLYSRPKRGEPSYQCVKLPGRGGCGGTTVLGWRADEQIIDEVIDRLAAVGVTTLLATDDDNDPELLDRIRDGEARQAELATAYADGEISYQEWRTASKRLDARLADDRAQLARTDTTRALDPLAGCSTAADLAARWDTLTMPQQRAILQAVLLGVDVHPGGRGGHWNPDRLKPQWRD